MALVNNLEELIGNTPLLRLNRLHNGPAAVYAKLEMFNPYSIKDRPAAAMLQAAEQAGQLIKAPVWRQMFSASRIAPFMPSAGSVRTTLAPSAFKILMRSGLMLAGIVRVMV